jgi:hypothetical protein
MEFITDKGSKIPLVDLPHNIVYNESGSYPQHRRRKMEDGDGDLLLTVNDADWINHILRCNNIDFKIISLLKSPDGPWYYHMVKIDNDIYYYSRAMKNGNQCIVAEKIFGEIHAPKFDCSSQVTYNGEYVTMSPMYPLYREGEWIYSIKHEDTYKAARETELSAL